MTDLQPRLEAWTRAGLIDAAQAAAILEFEAATPHAATPHAATPHAASSSGAATEVRTEGRRGLAAEALGYVGAALALGAIALLIGESWLQLTDLAQLALVLVLAGVLLGASLATRSVDRASVQRLASVLGTGGVVAVGWAAAIVAGDLLGLRDAAVGVTVGAAATLVAGALQATRPRPLTQITLLAGVLTLAMSGLGLPRLELAAGWFGLAGIALGLAWFALAAGRWLRPRRVGEAAGGVVALISCQITFASAPWASLLFGVLLAAGLVYLAVRTDELHHLVVGALGLFFLLPRLVFEWFGDAIGAPALLLVVGLLLVLLSVGLGRARRMIDTDPPAAEVRP